jgi:hypothetical protein
MTAAKRPADDERGGPSFARAAFTENEHVAEALVDRFTDWLRHGAGRVAARTRERAEDLWADVQHERNNRHGA